MLPPGGRASRCRAIFAQRAVLLRRIAREGCCRRGACAAGGRDAGGLARARRQAAAMKPHRAVKERCSPSGPIGHVLVNPRRAAVIRRRHRLAVDKRAPSSGPCQMARSLG
eukprot:7942549-Alexandrium_andersonii.AAC.1